MKSAVWNKVVCILATVPSGFPEQVDVPQPFLGQINTPLCIWLIRILVIAAFTVCLLYAAEPKATQTEQGKGEK